MTGGKAKLRPKRRLPYAPRRPVPQDCALPLRTRKAGKMLATVRRVVGDLRR